MTLEDDFTDIVKKARMGQGFSVEDVARGSSLPVRVVLELERGARQPNKAEAEAVAAALRLRPAPLADIARGTWFPESVPDLNREAAGIETVHGDVGGYAVKGYVVYDQEAGEAVLVDTAYNAPGMLEVLNRKALRLTAVCLTHGHADHSEGIEELLGRWPAPVYLGRGDETLPGWLPDPSRLVQPRESQVVRVGRLILSAMLTPGHTPGGVCYRVEGLPQAACCVGDTLFAGSIGRSNPFALYTVHLQSVRTRVLSLPARTVLLPGHGPATTVAEENGHNPFAGSDDGT